MPIRQPAAAGGALPRGGRIEGMGRNGKGFLKEGANICSNLSLSESSISEHILSVQSNHLCSSNFKMYNPKCYVMQSIIALICEMYSFVTQFTYYRLVIWKMHFM